MVESGYKNFVIDAWYGLHVPKGTPPQIVDLLAKSVNETRADPEVAKKLIEQLTFDTSGSRILPGRVPNLHGIRT